MSIEIIPNWHPIFVHFTIGLLFSAALFLLLAAFFPRSIWAPQALTAGRINLWLGATITCITLLAGWQAYNTVTHDGPSHAAMTDHRNWALLTAAVWAVLAVWSGVAYHKKAKHSSALFLAVVCAASILLGVTGYKGGEAVYRYGLGVMALPQSQGDGGHGSHEHHNDEHSKMTDHSPKSENTPALQEHGGDHHNHQH